MSSLRFIPRSPRSSRRSRRSRSMARWLVWMPAVMVGSLVYWTAALGLGGLSLVAVSAIAGAGGQVIDPLADETSADPAADTAVDTTSSPTGADEEAAGDAIVVHLQDSATSAGTAGTDHVLLPVAADDVDTTDVNDNPGAAPPSIEPTAVEPMSGSASGP